MNTIYTYGYGGKTTADLRQTADKLGAIIVDTRFQPRSRDLEWDRESLRQTFHGRYHHIPALGNVNYRSPNKPIQINHIDVGAEKVRPLLEKQPVILICVCQNVETCHRRVVAEELALRFSAEVVHLDGAGEQTQLALSIQQPWAWLIVNGHKAVENRSWNTPFRGRFYVHAGKTFDMEGYQFVQVNYPEILLPAPDEFKLGGIVGEATLVDVVEESDDPFFFGPYGFVLEQARPLPFLPCRGKLNFFRPEVTAS